MLAEGPFKAKTTGSIPVRATSFAEWHMNWRKRAKNWKLMCFVAALFAVFGHAPHIEPRVPDFVPSTTVEIQITGGQVANVTAQTWNSNHPWLTR